MKLKALCSLILVLIVLYMFPSVTFTLETPLEARY
jgi:hypothetical protein